MTDEEYSRKLDELDRLLNDPDVPMQPARIWSLLAELSHRPTDGAGPRTPSARARLDTPLNRSVSEAGITGI